MTEDKRDIVERLRATDDPLAQWAADEIERLQAELTALIADQRARKTVCCYLGVKPTFRCPDCPHDSALSSQQRGETDG